MHFLTQFETENKTKSYKLGNKELRETSSSLNVGNRVHVMVKAEAFITLKDHKDNFESNPNADKLTRQKANLVR